jgi:hypothetical protein
MLLNPLNDAIISVSSFVVAMKSFEPWILGYFQCEAIFNPEFFEFCDHTVSDIRDAFTQ